MSFHLASVKNLYIEADAKYIKGMLNNPYLQPNATLNQWIAGILLFDLLLFIFLPLITKNQMDFLINLQQTMIQKLKTMKTMIGSKKHTSYFPNQLPLTIQF